MTYLSQHYGVTLTLDYAITSFKPARWKVHVSRLRRKPLKDHGFVGYSFDHVTLGFGSIAGGLDHVNPVNRLPLEYRIIRRGLTICIGTMVGVDINTLIMEHYIALLQENQAPSVIKPKIGDNVNFKIKSQFMRELREDTFSENKNEDAHNHVDRVLNMGSIPRMTPTQALTAIQTVADHSQKWHDRTSSRNVSSNSNIDGLAAIIRPHLDKECPLNEEVKLLEEVDTLLLSTEVMEPSFV
nr:hypothetical protein [Tanacetum cinerariifolium]